MIPIFVLTCDRLESLKRALKSYVDCIGTPFEIVIVDFGSTYQPTVDYIKEMEHDGVKVYWEHPAGHPGHLNITNIPVQTYFHKRPKSNYVITDCDIELDNVKGDILDVYSHLLNAIHSPPITSIGPMLRIDDIPDYYPLKKKLVLGGSHTVFHASPSHTVMYKGRKIKYTRAPIDTTFGMYKAGTQWTRLTSGVRLWAPYSAKHLDWYIDPNNLSPDQAYYMDHASKVITHWSNWGRSKDGG